MSLAGFHEGRLPVPTGLGTSHGPLWQTETLILASGQEVRNARWARPQRRWDIVTPPLGHAAYSALAHFFNARRGRLHGFRFRDPSAFSSGIDGQLPAPDDQVLGTGDGAQTEFPLLLDDGGLERRILKPVVGTILLAVNGAPLAVGWSVGTTDGVVSFDVAPEAGSVITCGFEYDWPVRFDSDALEISHDQTGSGRVVNLPLVELFQGA